MSKNLFPQSKEVVGELEVQWDVEDPTTYANYDLYSGENKIGNYLFF
jgi:hypothetical protein